MKLHRTLLAILLPSLLLAYQPSNPPPVLLTTSRPPVPENVVLAPVIVGGALIIGAGWVGWRIFKAVQKIGENREHQMTNASPDAVVFTLDEDESGQ